MASPYSMDASMFPVSKLSTELSAPMARVAQRIRVLSLSVLSCRVFRIRSTPGYASIERLLPTFNWSLSLADICAKDAANSVGKKRAAWIAKSATPANRYSSPHPEAKRDVTSMESAETTVLTLLLPLMVEILVHRIRWESLILTLRFNAFSDV